MLDYPEWPLMGIDRDESSLTLLPLLDNIPKASPKDIKYTGYCFLTASTAPKGILLMLQESLVEMIKTLHFF